MAQVAILKQYFQAKVKLAPDEQELVDRFVIEFYDNPANPGTSLERVASGSPGVWSARVGRGIRAIIFKDGDTWALLHVDQHDPAYQWAANRKIGRHTVTGALEVVEAVETIRTVEKVITVLKQPDAPPLFDAHEDAYLLSLGVPQDWLPTLRKVRDDDQLMVVAEKLPQDLAERLFDLAMGKLVTPPTPVGLTEPVTASEDTRRRFYVVDGEDELRKVLAAPMEAWIAFLHPSQRSLVERDFNGPVKVSGSAGTGKTVVAMHRARKLAREGKNVLLTSFVTTLCQNIERNLRLFCTEDELSRIAVSTVHSVAHDLVRSREPFVEVASDDDVRAILQKIAGRESVEFEPRFLWAEWQRVVQAQGITTWDEYRDAARTGRGRPLNVKERKALWKVFGETQAELASRDKLDWPGLCNRARTLLETGAVERTFDAVIVDELQDLGSADIRFLKALCRNAGVDLILVGDAGQRIYPGGFSLQKLGIDVRGRSRVLRINYRTTEQIRRAADRVLGAEVDDMDGGTEPRTSTRSLLKGPEPTLRGFETRQAEEKGAVEQVRRWLDAGIEAETIGVFARTTKRLDSIGDELECADIRCCPLADAPGADDEGVRLGTMHRAKGLEFRAVLVLGCAKGELPNERAVKDIDDPKDREEAEARERRLLYVSMTRARDEVCVSWAGEPSPFLSELVARAEVVG